MVLTANSPYRYQIAQNVLLIWLSLLLLPLSSFILFSARVINTLYTFPEQSHRQRALISRNARPRTILVTGVGMTKGLTLARLFHEAGHTVVGADFESKYLPISCGRVSTSLKKFYRLSLPGSDPNAAQTYASRLIDIIQREHVDMWVSCSGVASALEDGHAKELIERVTSCKAIQFDVATTKQLHEKHSFIEHTADLGLTTPETHTVTSQSAVLQILADNAAKPEKYIMKFIGTDDTVRGDMTRLPFKSTSHTRAHILQLGISKTRPWILQQYISGPEFCTHAVVVRGEVKAFVACPSAELLMHYAALPAESSLTQSMLRFTREFAAAGGPTFTGHLSFDFLVEAEEAEAARRDKKRDVKLYPIECNPRAHTAVVLFSHTPQLAEAYLSLLEDKPAKAPGRASEGKDLANGFATQPLFPERPDKYYWIGHDLVTNLILPLAALFTASKPDVADVRDRVDSFLSHFVSWKDGTFVWWDPWPAWWLYHVYWPTKFALTLLHGKAWSRVNVSTCKMFEC